MKPKYMIGFFAALAVLLCLLSAGYRITYDHVVERQTALEKSTADTKNIEARITRADETDTGEETSYCLKELHGFVAVYLADGSTLYELTDIPVFQTFRKRSGRKLAAGKYIGSKKHCTAFSRTIPAESGRTGANSV